MKALSEYQQKYDPLQLQCSVRAALDVIRGRWKPSIVHELGTGPKRFGDLKQALVSATSQALSMQLRQLEADGIVVRMVYPEMPLRVEYSLSQSGHALVAVLVRLEEWAGDYLVRSEPVRRRQST